MPTRRTTRPILRYAFDERNRLLVTDTHDALKPTRVLEGRASVDPKNRLVYHVESDEGFRDRSTPETVALDGIWKLTPNHELALTVHETDQRTRQTLYLKGALVKAEAHTLSFALRRSERDLHTSQQLTFSGRWRADAHNRLTFLAEKADGSADRFTLHGGWEVGDHHELRYRYRQRTGARGPREEHALTFQGAWDITANNRLVYRLTGSDRSAFEFTASLQTPSLLAREGRLVYQVGIGVSGGRTQRQRVSLFGTWKLHRDLSVSFEVPYADGRLQAIRFEGTYALTPRDRLAVALTTGRRERLGLTVVFTKELVPDKQLFLRLHKDAEEQSVIGGVRVQF